MRRSHQCLHIALRFATSRVEYTRDAAVRMVRNLLFRKHEHLRDSIRDYAIQVLDSVALATELEDDLKDNGDGDAAAGMYVVVCMWAWEWTHVTCAFAVEQIPMKNPPPPSPLRRCSTSTLRASHRPRPATCGVECCCTMCCAWTSRGCWRIRSASTPSVVQQPKP